MILEYELRRSNRKTLSMRIGKDGTVIVSAPHRLSKKVIDGFVADHEDWIEKQRRRPPSPMTAELSPEQEETLRKKIRLGAGAAVLLCAVLSLVYLLNREHFASWDLEMVMGQLLVHTLPWIIAAFAAVIWAAFLCRRSMEREISLLKGVSGNQSPETASKPSCLPYVRIALYAFALVLIVLGFNNGGMRDVLVKAINICTGCIGLG